MKRKSKRVCWCFACNRMVTRHHRTDGEHGHFEYSVQFVEFLEMYHGGDK